MLYVDDECNRDNEQRRARDSRREILANRSDWVLDVQYRLWSISYFIFVYDRHFQITDLYPLSLLPS